MKRSQAHSLLLLAAAIWGFSFVGQERAMEHLSPLAFNAVRFAIGGLVLLHWAGKIALRRDLLSTLRAGSVLGVILFAGSWLQQAGIQDVDTGAGDAGFITGLYVVLVPILGLAFGRKTTRWIWVGVVFAFVGLYFLSVRDGLTMSRGDLLVLLGAFCWTFHILLIDKYTRHHQPLHLAAVQFLVCSALNGVFMVALGESIAWQAATAAWLPILYCGLFATAIGFTLQIVAQEHAHPSTAGILLSGEMIFAAIGGWLLLGERMDARAALGAALMMIGILLAQLPWRSTVSVSDS